MDQRMGSGLNLPPCLTPKPDMRMSATMAPNRRLGTCGCTQGGSRASSEFGLLVGSRRLTHLLVAMAASQYSCSVLLSVKCVSGRTFRDMPTEIWSLCETSLGSRSPQCEDQKPDADPRRLNDSGGDCAGRGIRPVDLGCGGASAATVTAQITVTPGMSASELATLLHMKGIIKSSRDFLNLIEANGLTSNLQQGTYTFSSNQTLTQIMNALKSGAVDANSKLVIPEGLATGQALSLVTKAGVADAASYASLASQPAKFAVPSVGGTTPAVNTLEGLLFPSTYILQPGETSSLLIKAQLGAFTANTASLPWGNVSTLKVTPYQVVIIASIIEKEAQAVPDRPKIARVYLQQACEKHDPRHGLDSALCDRQVVRRSLSGGSRGGFSV